MEKWQTASPATKTAIKRWSWQSFIGWFGYGLILWVAGGTWRWLGGWLLWLVFGLQLLAHPILLIPRDPELLAERQKGTQRESAPRWDRWITMLAGTCMMLSWLVAGQDLRRGWSADFPLFWQVVGLMFLILGFGLFMWAMVSNPFFAEAVVIQTERGHTVASGGPYRWIRHPGYLGAITAQLATPLLLASWWAYIPSICLAILYILRTVLEDALLQAQLPGYADFTHRTRYRLLPFIW